MSDPVADHLLGRLHDAARDYAEHRVRTAVGYMVRRCGALEIELEKLRTNPTITKPTSASNPDQPRTQHPKEGS